MTRFAPVVLLSALVTTALPLRAQSAAGIEVPVKALNAAWMDAFRARDIDRIMAVFDTRSTGLFILGGASLTLDSLRTTIRTILEQRTSEEWTDDLVIVTPLNDSTAFLQATGHGRYTLRSNGQTWEGVAYGTTALARKRGGEWKYVALQNAISGGRRATP